MNKKKLHQLKRHWKYFKGKWELLQLDLILEKSFFNLI